MAEDTLNLSPKVVVTKWDVPSRATAELLEGLKVAEDKLLFVEQWLFKNYGITKESRNWSYEIDAETGDLKVTIPTLQYEKSPQTAREWSVLAGVTSQLGPVFELITGANASPTGKVQ
jgi:hypothetical protein